MPTIGVSIAVAEPYSAQLQRYRIALGDRAAASIPTHITLAPPIEVAAAELPRVAEHLEKVAAEHAPFAVHLRGTGTFRPVSPVVFVGVVAGISQCEQLANAVRSGPLDSPVQFPYHPHVTVAHHLPDVAMDRAFTELADYEAAFEVSSMWMYVHDESDGWVPAREVHLAAPS